MYFRLLLFFRVQLFFCCAFAHIDMKNNIFRLSHFISSSMHSYELNGMHRYASTLHIAHKNFAYTSTPKSICKSLHIHFIIFACVDCTLDMLLLFFFCSSFLNFVVAATAADTFFFIWSTKPKCKNKYVKRCWKKLQRAELKSVRSASTNVNRLCSPFNLFRWIIEIVFYVQKVCIRLLFQFFSHIFLLFVVFYVWYENTVGLCIFWSASSFNTSITHIVLEISIKNCHCHQNQFVCVCVFTVNILYCIWLYCVLLASTEMLSHTNAFIFAIAVSVQSSRQIRFLAVYA